MSNLFNNMTLKSPLPVKQPMVTEKVSVSDAIPAAKVSANIDESDAVELSTKKAKKGPIKSLKGFIANVKKFFSSTGEYVKGTAKGVATGAVAGSVVFTAGAITNGIRQGLANRAAKRSGEVAKTIKKIPNKLLAGIVAVGALAANIWTASLNATQKSSQITARWTGVEPKK